METSIFLAKVLGLTFTISGISIFWNVRHLKKVVEQFMKDPALIYVSGLFTFILGAALIVGHNVWTGWPVVVTVLGWITLIKGGMFLWFPEFQIKLIKKVHTDRWYLAGAFIALVLGLFLLYAAYIGIA